MNREAPRTILSACCPYQKDVSPEDYEVIVVDNGSTSPFSLGDEVNFSPIPRIVSMPNPQPSPVFALNWAAMHLARGTHVLFAIDGARIFSDQLIANMLKAHAACADAFVYTLGCHLGSDVQMVSTIQGYNQEVEDKLIADSGWPARSAGLYNISVFAGSSSGGFWRPIQESNAFSMPRRLLDGLGGYHTGFTSPGGGLANLEIFARYVQRPNAKNICLLSDMTFHQVHGGIATSGKVQYPTFAEEYLSIFGREYVRPSFDTIYLGPLRAEAAKFAKIGLCES
ncbi:glycosyltransferase family 2 protein [Mesorhizobium sp. M2D.F.Ca.ET.185.01.1.1]|nr:MULTISPECIES: glycosyltransferase family A protein [unclassified Mesorhizobium]TGP76250.1 glycosyltransferase family 2 protein [bacterium M00.F.Ca.ET.227.01.1.1]TGP92303.1 glycosyltransferase family 2 protein [bacterium M00.F.Ca.ET.222.01.1.1]TGP96857.1 glycosyltransferase family 2 protein [bacterium M00.F.Ca.ET.221.01.1.1]TGU06681.1 glycosyltransferase family 2 protein [bacterium M00.F.Ca.ET.163.01.1.1]TGU27690.1 glycosyltransferase family 2 protein [bacterium M00.F.Ca.ET.156.01.1.1]TGU50